MRTTTKEFSDWLKEEPSEQRLITLPDRFMLQPVIGPPYPEQLTKEQFFTMIGAHKDHAIVNTIWDTLQHNSYKIVLDIE